MIRQIIFNDYEENEIDMGNSKYHTPNSNNS